MATIEFFSPKSPYRRHLYTCVPCFHGTQQCYNVVQRGDITGRHSFYSTHTLIMFLVIMLVKNAFQTPFPMQTSYHSLPPQPSSHPAPPQTYHIAELMPPSFGIGIKSGTLPPTGGSEEVSRAGLPPCAEPRRSWLAKFLSWYLARSAAMSA